MESEGLLVRVQDKKDGGKFRLSLTEKSQNSVSQIIKSWFIIQEDITKGFTEKEKTVFLRLLKQVGQNLDDLFH